MISHAHLVDLPIDLEDLVDPVLVPLSPPPLPSSIVMADSGPSNSLGLDFDALHIKDTDTPTANDAITALTTDAPAAAREEQGASTIEQSPPANAKDPKPDKKKPYVNLERVKTGGPQRVCPVTRAKDITHALAYRRS
jgi:hypothetical protein